MYTIKIDYKAPESTVTSAVDPICRLFNPSACAADNAAYAGTYYDTNVPGWGEGTSLAKFMDQMVAHPGLIAALRKAMRDSTYTISDGTEEMMQLMDEAKNTLSEEGFTITISAA